jgi:hypothetical protein
MVARLVAAGWIVAILAALIVGPHYPDAFLNDSPGCIFKSVTGVDCAFCGMTHATVALGRGDLGAAHTAHPLAIVVLVGSLAAFVTIVVGRTDLLLRGRRPLIILGAVCAVWAVRLLV